MLVIVVSVLGYQLIIKPSLITKNKHIGSVISGLALSA